WSWRQRGRHRWLGLQGRPREWWDEDLRRRRLVAERSMRTHGVVMPTPAFHDDPGLFERVEDLAVEEFVAQASIEALDVAILPWASGCDVGSLRPDGGDPVLHGRGDELRAVVGTDVLRHAAQDEQVGQDVDDVGGVELAIDADRQRPMRELVDHVKHAGLTSVMSPVLHDVVGQEPAGP